MFAFELMKLYGQKYEFGLFSLDLTQFIANWRPPLVAELENRTYRTGHIRTERRAFFIYSYACAFIQLVLNPRGKQWIYINVFLYFRALSSDKFSFSGSELCFSFGGWSSIIIRMAVDPWDGKECTVAETAGQTVVHKQASSIIRPAPRVCTQRKCLRVWKV